MQKHLSDICYQISLRTLRNVKYYEYTCYIIKQRKCILNESETRKNIYIFCKYIPYCIMLKMCRESATDINLSTLTVSII